MNKTPTLQEGPKPGSQIFWEHTLYCKSASYSRLRVWILLSLNQIPYRGSHAFLEILFLFQDINVFKEKKTPCLIQDFYSEISKVPQDLKTPKRCGIFTTKISEGHEGQPLPSSQEASYNTLQINPSALNFISSKH